MDINLNIVILIFIIILILELFFSDYFISSSSILTTKFQKIDKNFKYFFWIFHIIFFRFIFFFSFITIILLKNKIKILIFLGTCLINILINNYIKSFYHKSRPIFFNENINLYFDCDCSYGFLSGHCYEALFFYYLFYKEYFSKKLTNNYFKIFFKVLISLIILNVGLSRIYFGDHSYDQITAGYTLGLIFIIIYNKNKIHIKNFLENIVYYKNLKMLLSLITLILFLFLMNIIAVLININFRENYYLNRSKKCNYCFIDEFETKPLKLCSSVFAFVGLITGYFFNPNIKLIKNNKLVNFCLLIFNYFLLYAMFAIQIKNFYLNLFLKVIIYFLWGFNSGYSVDKLSLKLQF